MLFGKCALYLSPFANRQNGIVNRCWLDARIGCRLADAFFTHKLAVAARGHASDNKFSARCTRSNFSKRVYLAANDPVIYLCTLADVYLYAVPRELRGGSQESSFTEARAELNERLYSMFEPMEKQSLFFLSAFLVFFGFSFCTFYGFTTGFFSWLWNLFKRLFLSSFLLFQFLSSEESRRYSCWLANWLDPLVNSTFFQDLI